MGKATEKTGWMLVEALPNGGQSFAEVIKDAETFIKRMRAMKADGLKFRAVARGADGAFAVTTDDPKLAKKWKMFDAATYGKRIEFAK